MVTAAMIAMFYLGTASGVIGSVLVTTSRSREDVVGPPLGRSPATELRHAA
jgi:hypothetical protein